MKLIRSYILPIFPNFNKLEEIRYSSNRYILYLKSFVSNLYYNPTVKHFSTKGMGNLANKSQKQAMGIVSAERNAKKEKTSCPTINFEMAPASITKSKDSSYDYWITLTSQFKNKIRIPSNSHRRLNKKLKEGWLLSKHCEFVKKDDKWKVKVFITKEAETAKPSKYFLGIDVGIRHGVARSDRYLGQNLFNIIKEEKKSQAERQRQGHKKKSFKTKLKQILDREVNLTLRRSKNRLNIVVEHPKNLANLKLGKLGRWAKIYFSSRLQDRAKEIGAYVVWINPAYTSITCHSCKKIDKKSRVKRDSFCCTACGNTVHADINAARNIALKGQERLNNISR